MRRAALILLLAGVYVGCAGRPGGPETEPQAAAGGLVRLAFSTTERAAAGIHERPAFLAERADRWSRADPATLLDRIEFVAAHGVEPLDLLFLDEIDLTPVYGRQVERLLRADPQRFRHLRAPGWDRTYLLRCNSELRWTRDPNFRRWLAEQIDRAAIVEWLFDSSGAAAYAVLADAEGPRWSAPIRAPFERATRPTLNLRVDPDDRRAMAIGARLKAALRPAGIELILAPEGDRAASELTLLGYQRSRDDPVAAFEALLELSRATVPGVERYLEQARRLEGGDREKLVLLAEDAMLMDAVWIPLIRLDAWIGFDANLRGVAPGLTGDLAYGALWWTR